MAECRGEVPELALAVVFLGQQTNVVGYGEQPLEQAGRCAGHRVVDATGYEKSRYLAQDAEDRAADARRAAEALAREYGAPPPRPRRV
ncbi:hypothetical protein ACFW5D_17665 [Streptomyces sp. NPDC058770]|uniref:hypothetical protein n=1 Tax=Streptomyces sp. NPDC058770 TaxID=3346631 RepID=UPI00367D5F2C